MSPEERIEAALRRALDSLQQPESPENLRAAIHHAVFSGGSRSRPRLCLAVAEACGRAPGREVEDIAVAVELLHCASLAHDDLPCFDDAPLRRGRPSVHRAFGEEMAVLAGDGLIVMAFEQLVRSGVEAKHLPSLLRTLTRAAGPVGGLVAGQAWESEDHVSLHRYHRAKTGALFEAATRLGAILGDADSDLWGRFGMQVGEAYQVADDLRDTLTSSNEFGKPSGQDAAHDRPNAALSLGVSRASERMRTLLDQAVEHLPSCNDPETVAVWLEHFASNLLPTPTSWAESPMSYAANSRP